MRRSAEFSGIDLALLAVGLAALYVLTPFAVEGDGRPRFEALSALLSRGDVSRSPYSLIGPLGSAPLWLVGRLQGASEWWCARYNFVLFTLGLAGLYAAMTPAIARRTIVRFLLLLTLASMFPHHNGRYYGEVFTAVLVGVGLSVVVLAERWWGWILVVLGVANTPATLPGLALAAGVRAALRSNPRHLGAVVGGLAVVMAEAWLRRGDPFSTGYEGNQGALTVLPYSGRPGFSYPFALGLLSILFSFGKGLFLYAPGLVLARRPAAEAPKARELMTVWLAFLTGLVIVYAKWWSWYGGVFWGPRFFLFASLPASLALATWLSAPGRSLALEAAALACLIWSFWVGVNGLVFGLYGLDICTADHYALEFLCWYVPEFSALFRPFIDMKPLATGEVWLMGYSLAVCLYLAGPRLLDLLGAVTGRPAGRATPA